MNQYTMEEVLLVADEACRDIIIFLTSLPQTKWVKNVEDDDYYRKIDVDLLWCYEHRGIELIRKIEIKGDRYSRTGNFFFEVISNMSKMTPGCFLYSEADYFFYYFPDIKELNVLPLNKTRTWFLERENEFQEKYLKTGGNEGQLFYQTKGRIVPKKRVREEVNGVKTMDLTNYLIKKVS